MDISTTENLKTVRDSNQEMLDYFNGLYVAKLEQIQSLKTEQFELKIKIDELMKTLEVYSFKNSAGHNVFSPFSTTTTTQEEKAAQIEQELKELNASDAELTANIRSLQADADELKSRITLLHTATRKLDTFLDELADEFTKESTALEDDESTEEKSSGYQSWIQYLASEEIRSGQIGTDPTYRYSGSARSNQTYSGFPVMVDQIRYQPGNSHP